MKQIYTKDFGICPHCGNKMLYMISTYQLAVPGPGGSTLSKILGDDKDITAVCPQCNFKIAMESSIYGITTRDYAKLTEDKKTIKNDQKINFNIIGYIDSKER